MFKRFLKFFKGDEHEIEESFSGSYLEHLLSQVKPFVEAELKECPDHDPELLAIVGIFRGTMLNAWSDELRRPLVDGQTLGVAPPPPPAEGQEFDETKDFEAPADLAGKKATLEEADTAAEEAETLDDTECSEAPIEAQEDSDAQEEEEAPEATESVPNVDDPTTIDELDIMSEESDEVGGGEWSRITEEIDISDIQSSESSDETPPDTTLEMKREEIALSDQPRVDAPKVLQAGRMFLRMLLQNDKLPADLQLNVGEIVLARDLLLGYFVGSDDFDQRAKQLLALVEKKFSDGLFTQAQILLQLFHTDESTRVNNDRNLFYEDMILRLGIRRRHRLTDDDVQMFEEKLKGTSTDEGTRELSRWLNHQCLIKFHLCLVDPDQRARWKAVLETSTLNAAAADMLGRVPPSRWRPIDAFGEITVFDQIQLHTTPEAAQRYVISQLSTCYFILRAVGDTGLEGYLDTFFDWSDKHFGLNATLLMPILYNRSMQETLPMTQILDEIYEEFFREKVRELIEGFDEKAIEEASKKALKKLGKCDLGEIAPGYYDLGGFVFDQLFEMTYPSLEFGSKVHRIT